MAESDAEGLHEPLGPGVRRLLRRAVLDHALSERRRHHVPRVHVGVPGGPEAVYAEQPGEPHDHTLRTDVVAAMARRAGAGDLPAPLVWVTRAGDLELQDLDAEWLAAARAAYAEAAMPLVFVVANRHGWRDPRSGLTRTWVRLRRR